MVVIDAHMGFNRQLEFHVDGDIHTRIAIIEPLGYIYCNNGLIFRYEVSEARIYGFLQAIVNFHILYNNYDVKFVIEPREKNEVSDIINIDGLVTNIAVATTFEKITFNFYTGEHNGK